jgi:hypothetical protein
MMKTVRIQIASHSTHCRRRTLRNHKVNPSPVCAQCRKCARNSNQPQGAAPASSKICISPTQTDSRRLCSESVIPNQKKPPIKNRCICSVECLYRINFSYLRDGVKHTTKTAVWTPLVYRNALSTENGNPFVSRSLVRRVAVDLFRSIAVLAGQNEHVVMFW